MPARREVSAWDQPESVRKTLTDVAAYLGRSKSILSRMENGDLPFRLEDVEALLDLYRVTEPSRREAMLRFHRQAGLPAWWDLYGQDVEEPVIEMAWFESLATRMRIYSATVIDGLLQTADYARAVTESANVEGTDEPEGFERLVEMRLMRQSVLARSQPPKLEVVIDEAVLRRPIGGRAVMAAQLRHLLAVAERPHVELTVLPFAAGAHSSLDGGVRLLDLPEPLAEVASASCSLGQLYLEPPRTTRFHAVYDQLRQAALGPDESGEFIAAVVAHMEKE